MPKVSFILPAYKRRFLKEAIASILAQTYSDFELVVVDDCSPENLKEIVDLFHDERLIYHRNEVNIGGKDLVASWNRAMEYARGEWCILASDDDIYQADYLQEMVSLTEKYPQVGLVHCRIATIDAAGTVIAVGKPRPEFENGIQMLYHSSVLFADQRMADLMFRRRIWIDQGGFTAFPRAWYTDKAFAIACSWNEGAACSNRILFKFRESGENISNCHNDDLVDKINAGMMFKNWVWRLLDEFVPSNEEDEWIFSQVCRRIDGTIYNLIKYMTEDKNWWAVRRLVKNSNLDRQGIRLLWRHRLASWLDLKSWWRR